MIVIVLDLGLIEGLIKLFYPLNDAGLVDGWLIGWLQSVIVTMNRFFIGFELVIIIFIDCIYCFWIVFELS